MASGRSVSIIRDGMDLALSKLAKNNPLKPVPLPNSNATTSGGTGCCIVSRLPILMDGDASAMVDDEGS